MPRGLIRYQSEGDDHFITFSCYHRLPYLNTSEARDIFEHSLEQTRKKYKFDVLGYVVMPEHVHLLLGEPLDLPLSTVLQALKISVSRKSEHRPFWQPRYYDFNVTTREKRIEKIKYMHMNPVKRGLVETSRDWRWSSKLAYSSDESTHVHVTHIDRRPMSPTSAR